VIRTLTSKEDKDVEEEDEPDASAADKPVVLPLEPGVQR